VITTFLLFWSLYEFYTHKRWLLIGTICGLILLTRATAAPIIVFFILEMWQEYTKGKLKLADFLYLGTPFYVAIVLVCWYNFIRFHNPFNGGYAYQLLHQDSAQSRALGIFSLSHIPANLYSTLLRPPIAVLRSNSTWTLSLPYIQSNPLGMSIFITSPYLLSMFSQKWSRFDQRAKNLLVAIAISLVFVLSFYGIGADQYGVRYSLDYLPAVYLLFMIVYRKSHRTLTRGMTFLLLASGIFNSLLVVSYIK
jgi:hypothetical protein